MQEEKRIMEKLCFLADSFNVYIKNKCYREAVACYKSARNAAVKSGLPETTMQELFGERGERGVILKQGLFREELVQKAYYEEFVKRKGSEERGEYQKNSA